MSDEGLRRGSPGVIGDAGGDVTTGARVTVRDVLVDAERRLTAAGVPSPSVDSSVIVAHVLGTTRGRLFLHDPVTDQQRVGIEYLVSRRLSRVPLQHLIGLTGFRRLDIEVGPGVFIPRPETELVVEAGIRELAEAPEGERVAVDLCTGSGAIALSMAIEVGQSQVYAVELSEEALAWTRRNVAANQSAMGAVGSTLEIVHAGVRGVADADGPLSFLAGRASVVVSNPPYIPDQMVPREPEVRDHEPAMALFGGIDGLDVVREVVRSAAILLRPGGLLVIEHADVQGSAAGAAGVPGLLRSVVADEDLRDATGVAIGRPMWTQVNDRIDLNGLPRFTMARRA